MTSKVWELAGFALAVAVGYCPVPALAAIGYQATLLPSLGGQAPMGANTGAVSINDGGEIVGFSYAADGSGARAAMWLTPESPAPFGSSGSVAISINSQGLVVGYSGSDPLATLWVAGVPTVLGVGSANDINSFGVVVGGTRKTWSSPSFATVWRDGGTFYLGWGPNSAAIAINDSGQIIGIGDPMGIARTEGIFWSEGNMQLMQGLGGTWSQPTAINNRAQVVGTGQLSGDLVQHAILWNNLQPIDLGVIKQGVWDASVAAGINDSGVVVGYSYGKNDFSHATLWSGGDAYDLNEFLSQALYDAGWVLVDASAINNQGDIIGAAINAFTGETAAFLLEPNLTIPEPGSFSISLLGLLICVTFFRPAWRLRLMLRLDYSKRS